MSDKRPEPAKNYHFYSYIVQASLNTRFRNFKSRSQEIVLLLSNEFWEVNKSRSGKLSQIVRRVTDSSFSKTWVNYTKMATGSDNDFAEVTEKMASEKSKMWTVESLRTYLSHRNKSPEGDFEALVYRFVLFYHSKFCFGLLSIDQRRYDLC